MNHPESTGVGFYALNRIDNIRMSTALTYLRMARNRLNLTLRSEVLVHRILFDGNRAIGVEAESGGEVFRVEADQVILSGGAINSPQLLMLSGVGPTGHLTEVGIPVVADVPRCGTEPTRSPGCIHALRERSCTPRTRSASPDWYAIYHTRIAFPQRYADASTPDTDRTHPG